MFERITPEEAGIPSAKIQEFISLLERRGASTHSLIMMRGGKILAEYYWKPFNADFCHRMYSSELLLDFFSTRESCRLTIK